MSLWRRIFGEKPAIPNERKTSASRGEEPEATKKKAILDSENVYATLQDCSGRHREAEAVCDVCGFPTNFADGYSLTTKQIVPTVQYWEVALNRSQALLSDDKKAAVALGQYVAHQASQSTGWLVCEACAGLFQFDRASAREYARKRINPPGAGPLATPKKAMMAAFVARMKLKGKGA